VEWLSPPGDPNAADLRIRLVNADGSDAEISGNGTRCAAAWYCAQHHGNAVRIQTDAGLKTCDLISRDGHQFTFRTAMGEPVIAGELALGLTYDEVQGISLSMGNPQYVIFVEQFDPQWLTMATEVSTHPDFPNGTNVEVTRVLNPHEIEIRICERGVGETMSSGTGSSAAAVAAIYSGRAQSPVQVHAPGGTQVVEWNREVFLTGPARLLCRGEFFI
jgi:diaminopimelate epimerase